jgi:hypothetical protein
MGVIAIVIMHDMRLTTLFVVGASMVIGSSILYASEPPRLLTKLPDTRGRKGSEALAGGAAVFAALVPASHAGMPAVVAATAAANPGSGLIPERAL